MNISTVIKIPYRLCGLFYFIVDKEIRAAYRLTKKIAYKIIKTTTFTNRFKAPEKNESLRISPIDVFCVNLKSDSERRDHMTRQFNKAEIPDAKFTPAIIITDEDMKELVKDGKYISEKPIKNKSIKRDLLKSEIGCYASHLLIWREIINMNLPVALVCEDDIEFKVKYNDILDLISYLPQNADICHLDLRENPHRVINAKFSKFFKDRLFGTSCYLITQNGANKLLSNSKIFDMPVDHKIQAMHKEGKLNVYGTYKKYAIHLGEKEEKFSSTIR
jgi:glycosyl transferase family 25